MTVRGLYGIVIRFDGQDMKEAITKVAENCTNNGWT